jgi:hypothetical protein
VYQGCGPKVNGRFEKRSGTHLSAAKTRISTFFDMMTHLLVHLMEELFICGPIHTRWMYPIERYLKTLKGYVRNKARLEGSMAKGYALEEALGFWTKYLQDFIATTQHVWDEKEDPMTYHEVLEGGGRPQIMNANVRDMAHSFVLRNVKLMANWCNSNYWIPSHFDEY